MFRRKHPQYRIPLTHRVRDLELVSARLIRAGFAGDYHSAFHGRGIEFAQVREYQPGDDIRIIDWNVTARSGVPHVKEFIEERDLTVIVAVDVSGSMGFGSGGWRKCDLAARVAGAARGESRLTGLGRAGVDRRAEARHPQIGRRLRAAGVDRLVVSTAVPYERELLRFFKERMGKR